MFKKTFVLVTAMAALFAIACGDTAEPSQYGALDVQALGLTAGIDDVDKVVVTLKGEINYELELAPEAGRPWTGKFENVLVGVYTAQAIAYDGDETVLFASEVADNVLIAPNQTASLTFVLNQLVDDEVDVPLITSIYFSKTAVEFREDVDIIVQARAKNFTGEGLCGRYSTAVELADNNVTGTQLSDFPNVYCNADFTKGSFTPGADIESCAADGCIWTATTTWTANKGPGAVWFYLRAWNAEALAEMGSGMIVTSARVDEVAASVDFNLAPVVKFAPVRVLPDPEDGTAVYFHATVTDDGPGSLAYKFETDAAGCAGSFNQGQSEGTVVSGGDIYVRYQIAPAETAKTCSFTLTVSDDQNDDKGGSTSIWTIVVQNEMVANYMDDWTEFDVVTGGEATTGVMTLSSGSAVFTVAPKLPTGHAVTSMKARMILIGSNGQPVPNFVSHNAGFVATGLYDTVGETDLFGYLWIDEATVANAFAADPAPWHFKFNNIVMGQYAMMIEFIDAAGDVGATVGGAAITVLRIP